ncbi:TDP-N-acetylfucosamine:lipid II N-acetylfucosaminyltransferase [Chitinophaga oryzae]|uniref:TDP-N-acetylfucosamine:lipid II N-acetylfucosaminyltransferase n=1 Tax=Chitinophaga oryzae TaxID=2725414 RepID=A0AAE6ZKE6_9BACT|nr:TDP-N-acetylfucosamine:lipid II N-acetylfucosaminyltransferase [Chitinophaga oryzae]QJB33019.1 TDP-N-acetylfucosamine:lipid II N-acetylfucosaminyltransferase [Chitinophaga oryzae]
MNYHLMIDDKFIDDFIKDAEQVAPGNNIFIIDAVKEQAKHVKSDRVHFAPHYTPAFRELVKNISSKDKVFIHWASESAIRFALTLDKNIPLGLFFWGGDVVEIPVSRFKHTIYGPLSLPYFEKHEEHDPVQWNLLKPKKLYRSFAKRYIHYKREQREIAHTRALFFERLNYFLNWNLLDHDWIKQHYTTRVAYKYFFYNFNPKPDDTAQVQGSGEKRPYTTILLGNSDTITNNHLEALRALSVFKNDPVKLVIPLSYRDGAYADFVEQQAIAIFGKEKVRALRGFLPRDEYYKQLDEVDVAVMYHYRPQAAGNTLALLYRGKKVFVHHNSTTFGLLKNNHATVFDSADISSLSFEEFSRPLTAGEIQQNITIVDQLFDQQEKMRVLKETLAGN